MTLERMGPQHARDVAGLHAATLGGLLSRLGRSALDPYYDACAHSPLSTAFVAVEDSRVIGFVAGAESPRGLRRDVLRRNPLQFGLGALVAGLRNPSALIDLARGTLAQPSYDSGAPELIYLAVDPSKRGQGTGKALVGRFSEAMRTTGALRYELSVEARNADAQRFYERLGFTRIGTYEEFGTSQVRYAMHLTPGFAT